MNTILSKNYIIDTLKLQLFALLITLILIISFVNIKSKKAKHFFHFGKATEEIPIDIFGMNIDTDSKYICIMIWIMFIEAVNTWCYKIYKNWYRNKVLDPKSKEVGMSNKKALIIINLWELFVYIPKILNWFLLMKTGQLQFMIPQFIVKRLVSNYIDNIYLQEKK